MYCRVVPSRPIKSQNVSINSFRLQFSNKFDVNPCTFSYNRRSPVIADGETTGLNSSIRVQTFHWPRVEKESTTPNPRAHLKKPPWQIALTFFTKNLVLLLLLLLLSETILRLLFGNNGIYSFELDRLIVEETKSFLQMTTEMM